MYGHHFLWRPELHWTNYSEKCLEIRNLSNYANLIGKRVYMVDPHLLILGNPRKVIRHLSVVLDNAALKLLENEIDRNCIELFSLAMSHYNFAKRLTTPQWRQKVSRYYYSCYAASRAIRLYVSGEYSTESKDHQKIGDLPNDFPAKSTFSNKLSVLREDRNSCDYDHLVSAGNLVNSTSEALLLTRDFLVQSKSYLSTKGLSLRGRI